jgi:hypothetical protein
MKSLCCVALLAVSAFAQQHIHTQATIIHGLQHPELIPDVTAYSLVLNTATLSPTVSATEKAARTLYIQRMHLSVADTQKLIALLDTFRSRDENDTKKFNATIIVPGSPSVDLQQQAASRAFTKSRNAFVLATVEQIKSQLSPEGAKAFLAFVQNEKHFMVVSGGAQ